MDVEKLSPLKSSLYIQNLGNYKAFRNANFFIAKNPASQVEKFVLQVEQTAESVERKFDSTKFDSNDGTSS